MLGRISLCGCTRVYLPTDLSVDICIVPTFGSKSLSASMFLFNLDWYLGELAGYGGYVLNLLRNIVAAPFYTPPADCEHSRAPHFAPRTGSWRWQVVWGMGMTLKSSFPIFHWKKKGRIGSTGSIFLRDSSCLEHGTLSVAADRRLMRSHFFWSYDDSVVTQTLGPSASRCWLSIWQ